MKSRWKISQRRRWAGPGLALLCLLWTIAACAPRESTVSSYLGVTISKASITEHVERRMGELEIAGLALAIINRGEVVYSNTFGHADVEARLPVTDDTIFEGASLSKPVFAHFVMTFVEDGSLDLDRPLYEYLPHPDVGGNPRAERITARMVLSHRSGFPNWRDEVGGPLPINFEPGTGYEYSGEGFQYLAMVLLEISDTDWAGLEQLFQQRIAVPLGLERTVFIQTADTRRHKAEPYNEIGEKIDWRNDPAVVANDNVFVAGASIHSDTTDFAKWMIALMNNELLDQASHAELLATHSTPPPEGDVDLSYTLGFYKPHLPLTDLYGHGGNNDGFTSFFMLDIEDDWGFVLFTNSEHGEAFGDELFEHLVVGPNMAKLVATIVAVLVIALGLIWFVLRRTLGAAAAVRARRANAFRLSDAVTQVAS